MVRKVATWRVKEKYIETLKTKLPEDEIQDTEIKWERFKGNFTEAAGKAVKRSLKKHLVKWIE